jgi:hypothetical protein
MGKTTLGRRKCFVKNELSAPIERLKLFSPEWRFLKSANLITDQEQKWFANYKKFHHQFFSSVRQKEDEKKSFFSLIFKPHSSFLSLRVCVPTVKTVAF